MMLRRYLRKLIVVASICVAVLSVISPSVSATEPHEDPEIADTVFSGISLLRYYSGSLDFVLSKEPSEVEARLEKLPFANIPPSLEEAADGFATSSISISHLVVEIDKDLGKLRVLVERFLLDEAVEAANQTLARLSQAESELGRIEQATAATGKELKVFSAPEESDLSRSYDEVLERIDRIRQMLDSYQNFLTVTLYQNILTDITLEVQPTVAFVGDNIRFAGTLASEKERLAGREVDILLNSSRYVTVKTDVYGYYQGILQVPYWYIPELDVQALYYPQDKDVDFYLGSLSPVIKVKVLFYQAELELAVEDRAYPGLETTVSGRFDYGQSPPLSQRKIEVYFDDVLVTQDMVQGTFVQRIPTDPETGVGEHTITVSSAAVDRYASVVTDTILNVTRAAPVLDLSIPEVVMIPGSVRVEGKLYSEVGPLSGALIKMRLGKWQVELVSSEDGTFDTEINLGIGFSVIGRQDLVIQVLPQEPWHVPLVATRTVVMVNMINSGGILAILILLVFYLPGRLRWRPRVYPKRKLRPVPAITLPEPATTYSERVTALSSAEESDQASGRPRDRIFYWYRLIVRLIQGITKALLKPQQTLREFAQESSGTLGPDARYFIELTKIVERLLYSRHRPTEKDVENSRQLSHTIEGETELPVTRQPLLARQLHGEGTAAQFELNEVKVVGEATASEFRGRVLTTSPWRQISTWLWVLLILAVAYYAFILLFLLPLLVASLASCLPLVIVDDAGKGGTKAVTEEELKSEGV